MLSDFFPLGFFPTPVHSLKRLTEKFKTVLLYIKRDDHTGLGMGGNKTRKLEYLIYQARVHQCDAVITSGAAQSNHCRQTAAACAMAGLTCHLILYDKGQSRSGGNLLLDRLFGATVHWHDDGHTQDSVAEHLRRDGSKPYIIPVGGSNETGCLGYVRAMEELLAQQSQSGFGFDYIVIPTSSGGTQAGMILGKKLYGLKAQIIGINIDKTHIFGKPAEEHILDISGRAAFKFSLRAEIRPSDIHVNHDYDQSGYGVLTEPEKKAIRMLAHEEGILLDPVYTGRAFAGLLDLMKHRFFEPGTSVLFWHTGGTPALFGYAEQFA